MEDRYISYEQCIQRLLDVYKEHGQIILACDFDHTIFDWNGDGDTYPRVEALLKRVRPYAKIIIYTCRPKKQYEMIKEYMETQGLPYDTINEPIIKLADDDGTSKIYYNHLLDDKAGLFSSTVILGRFIDRLERELNNG